MINWNFYPQNNKLPEHLEVIIKAFEEKQPQIDSENFHLSSNEVLTILEPALSNMNYRVEKSKKTEEKIRIPVLFGINGKEQLAFEADAYSEEFNTVIEVEAGRAVANYQFLKDFYQASMMIDVQYLCIAVRNTYRGSSDFLKVCDFMGAMYISNKIQTPLKGILILGY